MSMASKIFFFIRNEEDYINKRTNTGEKKETKWRLRLRYWKEIFFDQELRRVKKDYLISWKLVYKLKESRGLGFELSLWGIVFSQRNGFRDLEVWHQVILSNYRTHPDGQEAIIIGKQSHRRPQKAIAQVFWVFSSYTHFVVSDMVRIHFLEDFFFKRGGSTFVLTIFKAL